MDAFPSSHTIYDLGFIRGVMWAKPMPDAYSEAMDRLIEFFVEGTVDWYQLPQPWRPRDSNSDVSDQQRDSVNSAYLEGPESAAVESGLPLSVIDRVVHPKVKKGTESWWPQASTTSADAEELPAPSAPREERPLLQPETSAAPSAATSRGPGEWSPERRAAAAERARGRKKPPFDEHLEAVRADFDAGLSFRAIGSKYGCSDQHVRNFLTKHGIDPRRVRPDVNHAAQEAIAVPAGSSSAEEVPPAGSAVAESPCDESTQVVPVPVAECGGDQTAPERHPVPRAEYEWEQGERERVIELRATGISWAKIGEAMGRSGASCAAMYHHLKHKDPLLEVKALTDEEFRANVSAGATEAWDDRGRSIDDEALETVREMVLQGKSMKAIGGHFNCGHQSVINFCKKHDIRQPARSQTVKIVGKPYVPISADALIQKHNGYAGKRDAGQDVRDDDWPDIQRMLERDRRSVSQIASDYDVDCAVMRAFIDKHTTKKEQPPGEARAPLH